MWACPQWRYALALGVEQGSNPRLVHTLWTSDLAHCGDGDVNDAPDKDQRTLTNSLRYSSRSHPPFPLELPSE
jgi:hypothetical protein